jgi:hypothetical protein
MAARGVRPRCLKVWTTMALVLAGSCAAPHAAPPPAEKPAQAAALSVAPPPPLAVAAPPKDACGASDLQFLIGKPRTDIPIPLQPGRRRVVCSTCPMTQDFVSYRQTIIYDAQTGVVNSVRCG